MIKRRFYKEEHGDRDEPSSASSSSSSADDDANGSDVEADSTDESNENAQVSELKEDDEDEPSSSSGYEREDRSAEEIVVDSSVGFVNEYDGNGSDKEINVGSRLSSKRDGGMLKKESDDVAGKGPELDQLQNFVLRFKSVYKCRICPRIVCLSEEAVKTHLNSKRHVRSEKLLKENRLKAMLNSDGEIENQETPAEMHARVMALAQNKAKKKNKGRQRQKKRSRNKKEMNVSNTEKFKGSKNVQAKKRRKSDA